MLKNTDVKTISVNQYEKFLFVLSWSRWTKLFLLNKTWVAIRFRAKTKLIMRTDYPKFIGMPAVRTDGGRSVSVRLSDYQIFWYG